MKKIKIYTEEQVAEGNGAQSKHTPGPWHTFAFEVYNERGQIIADCGYSEYVFTKDGCQANAERIVECVNALDGIEDPEAYIQSARNAVTEGIRIQKERDELLAALEGIKKFVDNDFPPNVALGKRSDEYTDAWEKMNQVIVTIKGSASLWSKEDELERNRLIELQSIRNRYLSEDEWNRLQELSKKLGYFMGKPSEIQGGNK